MGGETAGGLGLGRDGETVVAAGVTVDGSRGHGLSTKKDRKGWVKRGEEGMGYVGG